MHIIKILVSLIFVSALSATSEKSIQKDIRRVTRMVVDLSIVSQPRSVAKSTKKSKWISYKQQASGLSHKEFVALKKAKKDAII